MQTENIKETADSEKRYFAAANTCGGFKSYYDELFRDLNKLYIIKGGPGTGKNKLMRDVSNEARKKGFDVEHYYCSSDPSSLDGIIIRGPNIGVIDGTAPHMTDPLYPGAYDEIINLGDFWKTERLISNKERISDIINRKQALFVSVYHYLSAAGMISGELRKIIEGALCREKLDAAAERLLREVKSGVRYKREIRLTEAIGMDGVTRFDTFGEQAEKRYIIRDCGGTAYIFLAKLDELLKRKNCRIQISGTALNNEQINGIFLPEQKIAYICESGTRVREDDRIINTERFVDREALRQIRAKLRFGRRCLESLTEGALKTLGEIKKLHFELEDIYIGAMDFTRKEEFTKKLISQIFG